ncbi:MAG: hypothetical protein OHK0023_17160 [Anaerolineae bacterium]
MAIPAHYERLVGSWAGLNRVWMMPTDPARESSSTMVIGLVAQGKFLTLQYTWADEGNPQDGMIVLGQEETTVTAAWVDSWHMGDKMMICKGTSDTFGSVQVQGNYSVPDHPDWGWSIKLTPNADDTFTVQMHNIEPNGTPHLAVHVEYTRIG